MDASFFRRHNFVYENNFFIRIVRLKFITK